jgi:Domain of unknown function (DUF362)
MNLPRFVRVEQSFPDRTISDIPTHIRKELSQSDFVSRVPRGARIAIGVGSRGISNIATIVKSVVDFWKENGAQPFVFPAMGSHGAATGEGQADVLAHYGIHEATIGVPVISSLDVVDVGKTPEGIITYVSRDAYEADGIFLVGRVKAHTDFSGKIESGLLKMMAIGVGKLAGARQYHTFAYKNGLESVIRSVGSHILANSKILGGLAIQEGAHHETAGLVAVSSAQGAAAMIAKEEALLAQSKSWAAKLPAPEIDILIVDEIGKNISGAGMDTKVINRSVVGHYNPFPDTPIVHRIYVRGLSELTYNSGIGMGLADAVHESMVSQVDKRPTYLNALTASTPANARIPIHFPSDAEALASLAPTVGKIDLYDVTYCRIRNTLELVHATVSENLIPSLYPNVRVISEPFEMPFNSRSDIGEFPAAAESAGVAERVGH